MPLWYRWESEVAGVSSVSSFLPGLGDLLKSMKYAVMLLIWAKVNPSVSSFPDFLRKIHVNTSGGL